MIGRRERFLFREGLPCYRFSRKRRNTVSNLKREKDVRRMRENRRKEETKRGCSRICKVVRIA